MKKSCTLSHTHMREHTPPNVLLLKATLNSNCRGTTQYLLNWLPQAPALLFRGLYHFCSTGVTEGGEYSNNLHCQAMYNPLLNLTVDPSVSHDDTSIVSKCPVLWETLHVLTLTHSPCGQLSPASADSQARVLEDPSRVHSP